MVAPKKQEISFIQYSIFEERSAEVDTTAQFEYPSGLSGQARRGRTLRTSPGPKGSNDKETFLGAAGFLSGYFI